MPRKRTIQKGSIYAYRGKLRIKIRVPNAVDHTGKPQFMVKSTGLLDTARGRDLAGQMLEQMYLDMYLNVGKSLASKNEMMSTLFEEFMSSKRRMTSTERGYRLAYKTIVRGDYPPDQARIEADIQHFVTKTKVSKVSVNTYLRQFKAFLTWLRDERDVKVPNKVISRYGHVVRTNVRDFTDAEMKAILSDKENLEFRDMLIVMIETGARPVDVLTLKWDQVDLKKGMVTWLNKITKREEPRPISKAAIDALRRRPRDTNKVFHWTHASLSPLTKRFKTLCARVNVDASDRSLKHLRTTFKRRMMEKGFPFEVQMYLMRHSSADVTLGSYSSIDLKTLMTVL